MSTTPEIYKNVIRNQFEINPEIVINSILEDDLENIATSIIENRDKIDDEDSIEQHEIYKRYARLDKYNNSSNTELKFLFDDDYTRIVTQAKTRQNKTFKILLKKHIDSGVENKNFDFNLSLDFAAIEAKLYLYKKIILSKKNNELQVIRSNTERNYDSK